MKGIVKIVKNETTHKIVVTMLLFALFIWWINYDNRSAWHRPYNEDFEGVITAVEVKGTPSSRYNNYLTIERNGKQEDIIAAPAHRGSVDSLFFNSADPGDYIIKKKGSFKYSLVKGTDTLDFLYDTSYLHK